MGAGWSRSDSGDAVGAVAFPPESGPFFGSEFALGQERFPSMDPECFLFGEMADLYFLSKHPATMPEPPPAMTHINPLRSLLNLHKESLRLVRHARQADKLSVYHVEFLFDSDVSCEISVLVDAHEQDNTEGLPRFQCVLSTQAISCGPGSNQLFSYPDLELNLGAYRNGLAYTAGAGIPVVVLMTVSRASERLYVQESDADELSPLARPHCLATFAALEADGPDGGLTLRPLAQRLYANGAVFLLRELYGLEHKAASGPDDESDGDCLVCMSEPRDTLVLPCRHLCLCRGCAEVLRYQSSRCPICRAPFHSLLQLRVAVEAPDDRSDATDASLPPGYSSLAIIEALNPKPAQPEGAEASPPAASSPVVRPSVVNVAPIRDAAEDLVMESQPLMDTDPPFPLPGTPVSHRGASPVSGSLTTLDAVDLGHCAGFE
eukprot:m.28865 g.28865  ORF g.28865 m.28865 type:complete len:434 (-) comp4604_c0_seq1:229-1530(-)